VLFAAKPTAFQTEGNPAGPKNSRPPFCAPPLDSGDAKSPNRAISFFKETGN
jgi:hypothetical protein